MAFKDTVKEWFKTDLIPTEAQFYNLFNWIRWKDEKIPIADIEEIETILNAKAEEAVLANHLTDAAAHAAEFNAKEDVTNKGVADGYVPLNELVKIASAYLSIVDDVVTGGSTELLSAEQGKVLQGRIDAINLLLTSDNVNLDNLQELVDAIETVQTSLSTILVNDLTTGGVTKALTAEQGKVLKGLVDTLASLYSRNGVGDLVAGVNDQPYEQRVLVGYQNSIGSNYKHQVKGNTYSSNYGYAALGFLAPLFGDFSMGTTLSTAGGFWTANKKIAMPVLNLPIGGATPANVAGDLFPKDGNLYINGTNSGQGLAGSFGSGASNSLRSLTGLGLDCIWPYFGTVQTAYLLSQFLNTTQYGQTSLMHSGYHYYRKLVANGVTDAHPDMEEGAMMTVNGVSGSWQQLYFDMYGVLFIRGNGSNGWKKYTDSESGVFYPGTIGAIVCTKSYWQRTGKILTVTINGTANGTAYQEAEISYPNSYTCQGHTPGRILGASIASVPTPYVQNGDVMVYEGNANSIIKLIVKTPSSVEDYSFSVTYSIQIN